MGTTQALYYRFSEQGLQANDGTVFLSPTLYSQAMEGIRLAREREDQARRHAEEIIAQSMRETREIETVKLPASYGNSLPDEVVITDVSMRLHFRDGRKEVANFANLTVVWKNFSPGYFGIEKGKEGIFPIGLSNGARYDCYCPDGKEAERLRTIFMQAYEVWHTKFPTFAHAEMRD